MISKIPQFTKTLSVWGGALSLDIICKKILLHKLKKLCHGKLLIIDAHETYEFGENSSPLFAQVQILNSRAYSRIVLGGSVGAGESYIEGDWQSSQLVAFMQIFAKNRDVMNSFDLQLSNITAPLQKWFHKQRSNTIQNSRLNIQAHYDLGNDFFDLFLDESKMYSAGFYNSAETTLTQAQYEKNDRLCKKLDLKKDEHVLEIGTGWGGFALHAAQNYGVRVTTATISQKQFETAQKRVLDAKLENQVTVLLQDYRTLAGQFDKCVSIEMIEAVGLNHLPTYFKKCNELLKPNGLMALQSILIRDQYFDQAAKSVDFIQTHVFPGSAIPSQSKILECIKKHTQFYQESFEEFGSHYARTLHDWSINLENNKDQIVRLGYSTNLYRLWMYYFAYCQGGFLERAIGVGHFIFKKQGV